MQTEREGERKLNRSCWVPRSYNTLSHADTYCVLRWHTQLLSAFWFSALPIPTQLRLSNKHSRAHSLASSQPSNFSWCLQAIWKWSCCCCVVCTHATQIQPMFYSISSFCLLFQARHKNSLATQTNINVNTLFLGLEANHILISWVWNTEKNKHPQ